MKRKKSTQLLAVALTAAMLAQPVGAQMVFAEGNADAVQQEQAVSPAAETTGAVLKSGTAVIPADADLSQVKEILGKTLVENADQVDLNSLEWEYECKATSGLSSNTAWGSIEGFTSSKKGIFGTTTYTHPSLAANTDGTYKVRLKGTTTEVTLTKTQKLTSAISIKDNTNVNLVYNEDGSINYDAVRQNIFNTVVESTTPELTVNDVTIEYYATATTGAAVGFGKEWMPLEGGESGTLIPLTYPAMGDGTQKIKISYAGTDAYSGASAEATVNIGIGKEQSVIAFKENPTIKLVYNDDLTVDYAAAKEAIMNDVIDVENSSPEGLSLDNLTIEYYATGALGSLVKAWAPIEGGKVNGLTYPGIPEGTQKIRVTYAGDKENTAVTAETDITVIDREQSAFNLNEPAEGAASYEVPMAFNEDQTYDYDATAKAIYNAVVASTVPENLTADDVTIRYNAGTDMLKNWQPLNTTDWTSTFTKFGPGEWTIQFSWAGNKEYKGATTEVSLAKANVDDRMKIIELGESLDAPVRIDTYMYPSVRERNHAYNNQARLDPEMAAKARVEVLRREMGEEVFAQYRKIQLDEAENTPEGEAVPGQMTCRAGKSSFVVNWQGEMRSCVVLDKPSIPLRDVEFEEAWKFTKKETESLRISARCSSCKLRKVCNTCVAAAIAETGKADGVPEYLCRYTEATVRYLKETSKK